MSVVIHSPAVDSHKKKSSMLSCPNDCFISLSLSLSLYIHVCYTLVVTHPAVVVVTETGQLISQQLDYSVLSSIQACLRTTSVIKKCTLQNSFHI